MARMMIHLEKQVLSINQSRKLLSGRRMAHTARQTYNNGFVLQEGAEALFHWILVSSRHPSRRAGSMGRGHAWHSAARPVRSRPRSCVGLQEPLLALLTDLCGGEQHVSRNPSLHLPQERALPIGAEQYSFFGAFEDENGDSLGGLEVTEATQNPPLSASSSVSWAYSTCKSDVILVSAMTWPLTTDYA